MNALLLEMDGHHLLSEGQVLRLRAYISQKYEGLDASETAQVFAHAVHTLLERYLTCLEVSALFGIKQTILKEVVQRRTFYITGYDVFKGVLIHYKNTTNGLEKIKVWLADYCRKVEVELQAQARTLAFKWTFTVDSAIKAIENFLESAPSVKSERINDDTETMLFSDGLNIGSAVVADDDEEQYLDREWLIFKESSLPKEYKAALLSKLSMPLKASTLAVGIWMLSMTMSSAPPDVQLEASVVPSINVMSIGKEQVLLYQEYGNLRSQDKAEEPQVVSSTPRDQIRYRHIDSNALRAWLIKRGSLLSDELHLSVIIEKAKKYNLDPVLLIAITGQEQNFVKKNGPNAHLMINNPFNVHGSWRKYNTNLEDSTDIACRTLLRLVKNCPQEVDPIRWINRRYAVDKSWWRGVKQLMHQIETYLGTV